VGSDSGLSKLGTMGNGEIRLLARVLETTKANLSLICESGLMSTVRLEYAPGAKRPECGALD
jgi:hypothetical protein